MAAKEKELHENYQRVKNQSIVPSVEVDTTSLSEAMYQVKMKDVELTGLKKQNQNPKDIPLKKEEEKKKLEERCQELINQNTKLTKQVVGQMALQGAKHMIWDEIIKEANKFRPYLYFIVDQESALKVARQNMRGNFKSKWAS